MTYHIVRMNENAIGIAKTYKIELDELKEYNTYISDWNHLIPGTKLRLPDISDALNVCLDTVDPFIEEYYPKLSNNYKNYSSNNDGKPLNNIEEVISEDTTYSNNDIIANNEIIANNDTIANNDAIANDEIIANNKIIANKDIEIKVSNKTLKQEMVLPDYDSIDNYNYYRLIRKRKYF